MLPICDKPNLIKGTIYTLLTSDGVVRPHVACIRSQHRRCQPPLVHHEMPYSVCTRATDVEVSPTSFGTFSYVFVLQLLSQVTITFHFAIEKFTNSFVYIGIKIGGILCKVYSFNIPCLTGKEKKISPSYEKENKYSPTEKSCYSTENI